MRSEDPEGTLKTVEAGPDAAARVEGNASAFGPKLFYVLVQTH